MLGKTPGPCPRLLTQSRTGSHPLIGTTDREEIVSFGAPKLWRAWEAIGKGEGESLPVRRPRAQAVDHVALRGDISPLPLPLRLRPDAVYRDSRFPKSSSRIHEVREIRG